METFLRDYKCIGIVKRTRFRSPSILEFTGTRRCLVPGCKGTDITVHHLVRGRRPISSDCLVVPLCWEHHMELDRMSSDAPFEQRYGLVLPYEAVVNLELFLVSIGHGEGVKASSGPAPPQQKQQDGFRGLTKKCNKPGEYE